MNVGVVVFPGSNCDRDVHQVLNRFDKVRAEFVWHTSQDLNKFDAIVIPGGFAFGDRLRAGIIAAQSPVMKEVKRLANTGVPVLGICNGFQILVEAGLLPGALTMNDSLKFVCRWTRVRVENSKTPFTCAFEKSEEFGIPVAHGEGRYLAEPNELARLKMRGQIVLRYVGDDPNGSSELIAAVCNERGNVVGMMPHPERASDARISKDGSTRAATVFRSLVDFIDRKVIA
jgi:phosphoribosylformylglycinamidine synthase